MKVLSQYLPVLWENKTIVNRMFLYLHPLSRSWFIVLRAQPPVPGHSKGGEERKTLQYFVQKETIRKTRCANILEKIVSGKLGFFTSWSHETKAGRILLTQYVILICTLFTPGCQTFRDERHYISLNFCSKITPLSRSFIPIINSNYLTPVITIIGVPFTVLKFEVN